MAKLVRVPRPGGGYALARKGNRLVTDAGGAPCCCGEDQRWWPAEQCDGPAVIYVLTTATCNGGSGIASKVIVISNQCYLVDAETDIPTADLPDGAVVSQADTFDCEEDCESAPCADQYVEMSYCIQMPFRPASRRVFIPADKVQLYYDEADCAVCCTSWKINNECVGFPSGGSTSTIPAGAFLATGNPSDYPRYNGCCDCVDTCTPANYSLSGHTGEPSYAATDCPSVSSGQTLATRHTISYSANETKEVQDFTPTNRHGGDSFEVRFSGSASGTNDWRSGNSTPISHGVNYTGDCDPSSGNSSGDILTLGGLDIPMPPFDIGTAFGENTNDLAHLPMGAFTMGAVDLGAPLFLILKPSYSLHDTINLSGDGLVAFRADIEWTATHVFTCQYYSYNVSCDITLVENAYVGSPGNRFLEATTTRRATLNANMSGFVRCGAGGSNVPCCDVLPPDESVLSRVKPGGILSRLLGGQNASRALGSRRPR